MTAGVTKKIFCGASKDKEISDLPITVRRLIEIYPRDCDNREK